ncbi:MAG: RsmD family RNA methyltransferase [Bifidobacteriaceae bacterium]|jgi:16S rRNA (guanine966-N2)-methyltransferase|nr:RsmD family RNA methyltransferase [Bifidobacteriaceae bacterium]
MKIISGKYKGLTLPKAYSFTRPTTSKVKEAIFSKLENKIDFSQFIVYDLFAGTGALGFEALSRGAKEVYLIDNSKKVVDCIESFCENISLKQKDISIFENIKIKHLDAAKVKILKNALVFLDPPYSFEVNRISKMKNLENASLIVYEHSAKTHIDFENGIFKNFYLEDESIYSDTIISFICKKMLD